MSRIFEIDLGTENSLTAATEDGAPPSPVPLPPGEGNSAVVRNVVAPAERLVSSLADHVGEGSATTMIASAAPSPQRSIHGIAAATAMPATHAPHTALPSPGGRGTEKEAGEGALPPVQCERLREKLRNEPNFPNKYGQFL